MTRTSALADAAIAVLIERLGSAVGGRLAADPSTLAHARHLGAPLEREDHAALLHHVALHEAFRGDSRSARDVHEQVLDARRRLLGDGHPDTLSSMNNLAETLRGQGDLEGARDLHEQALDARRRADRRRAPRHAELDEQPRPDAAWPG
jgi:hypothetical protein